MPTPTDADRLRSRLAFLRDQHRRHDQAADEEGRRRFPDEALHKRLKRARLALRDEIVAVERRLAAALAVPSPRPPGGPAGGAPVVAATCPGAPGRAAAWASAGMPGP